MMLEFPMRIKRVRLQSDSAHLLSAPFNHIHILIDRYTYIYMCLDYLCICIHTHICMDTCFLF